MMVLKSNLVVATALTNFAETLVLPTPTKKVLVYLIQNPQPCIFLNFVIVSYKKLGVVFYFK